MTLDPKVLNTIPIKQTVGKTIKNVYHLNETLVLKYTDGTFSYLTSSFVDEYTIIEEQPHIWMDRPSADVAILFGIYTQEEYDAWCDLIEKENEKTVLKNKRRQYEELKKLFEPAPAVAGNQEIVDDFSSPPWP